jgi:hypothetical protein
MIISFKQQHVFIYKAKSCRFSIYFIDLQKKLFNLLVFYNQIVFYFHNFGNFGI